MRRLSHGRAGERITVALFFVGAALGLCFLVSVASWFYVVAAATVVTALHIGKRGLASKRVVVKIAGGLSWLVVGVFYVLLVYFIVTWGVSLAWTTPSWTRLLVALLACASLLGLKRSRGLRVPMALPLGVWIAACLSGWLREESFARCDDYLAARAQPELELIAATTSELAQCTPGGVLHIGRYPRKTWESPDGRRYVVTTQTGNGRSASGAAPGLFDGLVCEVAADGFSSPRCLGGSRGKSHGIADAEAIDEIFVAAWAVQGSGGSVVLRLPRDRPIALLEEHSFDGYVGDLYYQPTRAELVLFTDECDAARTVSATDFSARTGPAVDACPSELRYDAKRDVGLWCGGPTGLATVFHGDPFSYRVLARDRLLGWIALSWGCDWDTANGKIYSAAPNLGLLVTLDTDSGRVDRQRFVGFGMRSVAFDPARRRVYLTDFLGGDVVAVDVDSGLEVRRWHAGRFLREVRLTRDGRALLVTSNLGLWRINLDRG